MIARIRKRKSAATGLAKNAALVGALIGWWFVWAPLIIMLVVLTWWAMDETMLYFMTVLQSNQAGQQTSTFIEAKSTGVAQEGVADISGVSEPSLGGGNYDSNTLGYFGALFFWLEYETGCTDDTAFDSVTLNDGLGGQAYGMQFDLYQGSLQEFLSYCLEKDPEKWSMFKGLNTASKDSLYATSQSSTMPAAWHAAFAKDRTAFATIQKEFILAQYGSPVYARLESKGYSINSRSDVVKGALLSYAHQHGTYYIQERQLQRAGITNADSDAEFIQKLYDYRTSVYANYGGLDLANRYSREVKTALQLLEEEKRLAGSSNSESGDRLLNGATIDNTGKIVVPNLVDWQPKIVQVAMAGEVSYTSGWCEKFVGDFYDYVIGYPVVRRYCCARNNKFTERVSEDYNKMPAGALVYSDENYQSRTTCGTCGRNAGHVALYIGNDTIVGAQNSYVLTKEQWYTYFGWGGFGFNLNFPSYSKN